MVGRPFIAEVAMLRQRRMVGKVARIGERGARIAEVVGASCIRCSLLFRLATVKWTLPSALSADGETVAALAVHIDEAELKAESSCGAAWAACRITCSSLPGNPLRAADADSAAAAAAECPVRSRGRPGFHFIQPCSAAF